MESKKFELKNIAIINEVLILLAIVFVISQFSTLSSIMMVNAAICTLALILGVIYTGSEYKKGVAEFFQAYMFLYFASSVVSLIAPIVNAVQFGFNTGLCIAILVNIIVPICVAIVAFGKDLGKDKSAKLSYVDFIANVVLLVSCLCTKAPSSVYPIVISNFLLSINFSIFIYAKYIDKEKRGAE